MKTRMIAIAALLSLGMGIQSATASDEFVGAMVGGGVGALIGNSVHRHGNHGAVAGGIIGAITGAAIAHNNRGYDAPREAYYQEPVRYRRDVEYYEPQPVYYRQRVEYTPQTYYRPSPVIVYTQPSHHGHHHGWEHRRHDRHNDSHYENRHRGHHD